MKPELSVILAFRNAREYLDVQLHALVSQSNDDRWELVAVDNGSVDGSRELVESFSDRLTITLVTASEKPNQAYARNVGVEHSFGNKLIFIDADDEIAPGYLSAMSKGLDHHEFVTSTLEFKELNPGWLEEVYLWPSQAEGPMHFFDFLPSAVGCSIGVRREVFESQAGFQEAFASAHDIAFSWTLQLSGVEVCLIREAVVHYRYRDSIKGLFSQNRMHGFYATLLYREFRDLGMPPLSVRAVVREWKEGFLGFRPGCGRAGLAKLAILAGYYAGVVVGCLRHRVAYFG